MDSRRRGWWSWYAVVALVACVVAAPAPAAAYRVDVHAHATVGTTTCPAAADLITAMDGEGLDVMILMSAPFSVEMTYLASTSDLERCFPTGTYGSRIKFMYGGAELNHLMHAAGRYENVPSADRWDPTDPLVGLYPNGCVALDCTPLVPGIEKAVTIEDEVITATDTKYYDEFVALAEAAAASGRYVGFGEIAGLHYSLHEGHGYINFPANHPWMLRLVDIAAAAPTPMVIDLHLEMTATTKTELEELLARNRSVNIILEHAGWSTYGTATAAILDSLMSAFSNLYLALKHCQHALPAGINACYLDSTGTMRPEWATLLSTYADRIMIGTDAKYWSDATPVATTMSDEFRPDLQAVMNYFRGTATKAAIAGGTARTLFRLP